MTNWFKFNPEGWLYGTLNRELTPEQIVVYIGLLSLCANRKYAHTGYIAVDNFNPPKFSRSINDIANSLCCSEDIVKETIAVLVKTGRMEVAPNGMLRIISWELIKPHDTGKGYSDGFDKDLKVRIKERDEYKCQRCGIPEEEYVKGAKSKKGLIIHHIDYDKLHTDDNNLISLCINCHMAVNYNRAYWAKVFDDKLAKFYNLT